MTTAAMVFGMMPLALAIGAGAEQRAPMARAVIGGLITSTLLTLVVVPVMYTILEDGVAYVRHQLPALLRRRPQAPPVVGPLRPVPASADATAASQPAAVYKFKPKDKTDVA
jgi:HAE1 family hydrophobic/amphiphilic exporter-1